MTTADLRYRLLPTPWGPMAAIARGRTLVGTVLPDRSARRLVRTVAARWPGAAEGSHLLAGLAREVADYAAGRAARFTVPISLADRTEFQRSVLAACRRIPAGQVLTYGDLARRTGRPGAARAVGRALAANPIPLVIPCHRVVPSDGSIGGFSAAGGRALKRRMLEHERRWFAR